MSDSTPVVELLREITERIVDTFALGRVILYPYQRSGLLQGDVGANVLHPLIGEE